MPVRRKKAGKGERERERGGRDYEGDMRWAKATKGNRMAVGVWWRQLACAHAEERVGERKKARGKRKEKNSNQI